LREGGKREEVVEGEVVRVGAATGRAPRPEEVDAERREVRWLRRDW